MAEESEISKRIDDVHRRLDDLRGGMNARFRTLTWFGKWGAAACRFSS